MKDCKSVDTLMKLSIALVKAEKKYTADQKNVTVYLFSLNFLMHIILHSKSDITFSVFKLSQYLSNLTDQHWKALKQVIKYLADIKDQRIIYRTEKLRLKLTI